MVKAPRWPHLHVSAPVSSARLLTPHPPPSCMFTGSSTSTAGPRPDYSPAAPAPPNPTPPFHIPDHINNVEGSAAAPSTCVGGSAPALSARLLTPHPPPPCMVMGSSASAGPRPATLATADPPSLDLHRGIFGMITSIKWGSFYVLLNTMIWRACLDTSSAALYHVSTQTGRKHGVVWLDS